MTPGPPRVVARWAVQRCGGVAGGQAAEGPHEDAVGLAADEAADEAVPELVEEDEDEEAGHHAGDGAGADGVFAEAPEELTDEDEEVEDVDADADTAEAGDGLGDGEEGEGPAHEAALAGEHGPPGVAEGAPAGAPPLPPGSLPPAAAIVPVVHAHGGLLATVGA